MLQYEKIFINEVIPMKNMKGNLLLALTAFIWGTAFVAQSTGVEHIGPFTFNGIRSFLGFFALLPVIFVISRKKKDTSKRRDLIIGGLICGTVFTIASMLQQIGLVYTEPGKAGFITALYIVIVPIIEAFMGKRLHKNTIWAILIALVGMYLLCITDSLTLSKGDFLVLLCAVFYSFHIIAIDKFSPKVDGVKLSAFQFLVAGIVCCAISLPLETQNVSKILDASGSLLYTGILSSGVAYTLQIIGQKYTSPVLATIIMSLESVFAALAGWVVLKDVMSPREIIGALLMFVAIMIAQLPADLFKRAKQG